MPSIKAVEAASNSGLPQHVTLALADSREDAMGVINHSVHAKIAGKRPSDMVNVVVWLREPHFLLDEEIFLRNLGCKNLIQTSRVASFDIPVGSVQTLADLPSVLEVK